MTALATSEEEFLKLAAGGLASGRNPAFLNHLTEALSKMPQAELPLEHSFCEGIYARTMHAQKGAFIVGDRHAAANFFVLLKGTVYLFDEINGVRLLEAPHMEAGPIGQRRIGYCVTACEFVNFFPTCETNLEKLEKQLRMPETQVTECTTT